MKKFFVITMAFILGMSTFVYAADSDTSDNAQRVQHLLLANGPPGLQKKGVSNIPPSGHVPPGWNKGVKRGWYKDHHWHWNKKTDHWERNHSWSRYH